MRFQSEFQEYYIYLSTLKPDTYLVNIWEQCAVLIDGIMKETTGISGILCGYYTDNINVWINKDLFYQNEYIWLNLYYYEIFADIYECSIGNKKRETVKALLHKYWRNICDDGSEQSQELWKFQEFLFLKWGGKHRYNYSANTLKNSSIALLYVMFHELTHLIPDILNVAMKLVEQTDFHKVLISETITERDKKETACDLYALYILLNNENINLLNQNNEQKFEIACIALCLNGIYDYIYNMEPSKLRDDHSIDCVEIIENCLYKRLIPLALMAKMAHNSNLPGFIENDYVAAWNRACKIITDLTEVLLEEAICLFDDIEEYENISEEDRPIYKSKRTEKEMIWIHSTISR